MHTSVDTRSAQAPRARVVQRRVVLGLATVGLLLVAAPAWAVTIALGSIAGAPGSGFKPNDRLGVTSSTVGDTTVKHVINIADCEAIEAHASPIVTVTWSWLDKPVTLLNPQYGIKVAPSGKTCDANSMTESRSDSGCKIVASDKDFQNPTTGLDETVDIDLREVLGATKCTIGTEVTAKVYFIVTDQVAGTGAAQPTGIAMNIDIDLLGPKAPTIQSLSPGNRNLRVEWKHVDEDKTPKSRVVWSTTSFAPESAWMIEPSSDKLTGTSYQITGVDNGTTYYVSVLGIDANDNESDGSPIKDAKPLEVQDLWQYYKAYGGAEEGGYGCTASPRAGVSPLGLALLLALGALPWLWRRRRKVNGTALVALLALGTLILPAAAQAASPRTASLDVRFSQYEPGLDREFEKTGARPYGDVLEDAAWEVSAAIDWKVFDAFGELSFGLGFGYWDKEGNSRAVAGGTTQDKTKLTILPVTLDAVYRFDILARRFDFPLVPYAKAGFAYGFWWLENGLGNISSYVGQDAAGKTSVFTGRGGTAGLHGTVGLRLMLDVFEPQAARSFDIEMGVNHSYLFAEYRKLSLNDFGSDKSLDLSDDQLVFGVAFDL